MKVAQFIKWLEKQDQSLEVCVIQADTEHQDGGTCGEIFVESVCFDDPTLQSSKTEFCLILGTE